MTKGGQNFQVGGILLPKKTQVDRKTSMQDEVNLMNTRQNSEVTMPSRKKYDISCVNLLIGDSKLCRTRGKNVHFN